MHSTKDFIENKMHKKRFQEYVKKYVLIIFIVLVFLSGLLIGKFLLVIKDGNKINLNIDNQKISEIKKTDSIFDSEKFNSILELLKTKYYDPTKISDEKIFDGALSGVVSSLGDPYTTYFDKEFTKSFNEEMTGSFSGIGAEIGIKNDTLTIIAPLPNTPAEKSGIRAGDRILKIDKEDTFGMSTDVAVSKIRGEKGTSVVLNVLGKDDKEAKDLTIVRDSIVIESVTYEKKDNTGIIKISSFNDTTSDKFREIANNIVKDKTIKDIILDLRNNPGGYLSTAIDISSYWIKDGVIVSEKNRNQETKSHNSVGHSILENYKTIVLINQGSASASEIVSGALHDHNKAVLVGKKSFGKGSVQEYQEFSDGTALKVTVAEWFTPNGININKNGITPDIDVEYTLEDFNKVLDPQLDKAFEEINKK